MEEEKTQEPAKDAKDESLAQPKIKDSTFIYAAVFIVIMLLVILFVPRLLNQSQATLEELHEKNIAGKLSADKGYMYNGVYSFVLFDNLWYTQVSTPDKKTIFSIPFHYSPRDVEYINPEGILNYTNLDKYQNIFVTFDPKDENLKYIAVSVGEADLTLIKVFGKGVIASCTNNESDACIGRPIVDCNSTDAPVVYFASENQTKVLYLNNCIIVSGREEELFKATDRMLFNLLGIMP